jgi:hypothetical protein
MDVWWEFRCDQNHLWEAYGADGSEPPAGADACPVDGAPAVTAKRMPPADRVRLSLVPSARIDDVVRGTVARDDAFYIEVTKWDLSERLRSDVPLSWDEASRRLAWFRGLTWDQATARWARTGAAGSES